MKRRLLAIGACTCLAAGLTAVLAQGQITTAEPRAGEVEYRVKLQHRDPSEHARQRRVAELLDKWKAAEEAADRRKLEESLRGTVKEEFEARFGSHEKEIERLEARVKQLREQLERRRDKQDEIVDFRVQQLLREAQGLGWGTEPVTSPRRVFVPRTVPKQPGAGVPRR